MQKSFKKYIYGRKGLKTGNPLACTLANSKDTDEHHKKLFYWLLILCEPVHEISNNVVCATSKASDQPAHMRSLIRAFASRLEFLS